MTSPEPVGDEVSDITILERGVLVLVEALETALEELGSTVPPGQLRALLIIERIGRPCLSELADALGTSASATSRLCDRMQTAGLLERTAAGDRRGIALALTASGRRLAEWVSRQRRDALRRLLGNMSPAGRDSLERGLRELQKASSPVG